MKHRYIIPIENSRDCWQLDLNVLKCSIQKKEFKVDHLGNEYFTDVKGTATDFETLIKPKIVCSDWGFDLDNPDRLTLEQLDSLVEAQKIIMNILQDLK